MAHPRIQKTGALETVETTRTSLEEAAYYAWLGRTRHAYPGDHLTDWAEAEKLAQKGFPEAPSTPGLSVQA